jgi:hypothetical protein
MENKITQKEINQIVWKACDTFRGVLNSNQYKDYVLTMLFVKYVSDVWKDKKNFYATKYNGDAARIERALAKTRDMELDNEKRSVKLIKKWDLPIDTKTYTRKANAYVQFYNYLYYTRRWCHPDNSPARNPKVWKKMPASFRMNYEVLEEKYFKIFEEAGI